jgi:hypothetical protein
MQIPHFHDQLISAGASWCFHSLVIVNSVAVHISEPVPLL